MPSVYFEYEDGYDVICFDEDELWIKQPRLGLDSGCVVFYTVATDGFSCLEEDYREDVLMSKISMSKAFDEFLEYHHDIDGVNKGRNIIDGIRKSLAEFERGIDKLEAKWNN